MSGEGGGERNGEEDVVTIGDGRRSGIARSGGIAVTGMRGWRRWREREVIYECRRERERERERKKGKVRLGREFEK